MIFLCLYLPQVPSCPNRVGGAHRNWEAPALPGKSLLLGNSRQETLSAEVGEWEEVINCYLLGLWCGGARTARASSQPNPDQHVTLSSLSFHIWGDSQLCTPVVYLCLVTI
jgi:hypothetical protein